MAMATSNKTFVLEHKIYLNETNAVGGVAYFSNYIKWQGMAREEYFIVTVPVWQEIVKEVSYGKVNMITVEEHSHFIQHAYFGDTIVISLQTANIRTFSFDMIFFMTNKTTNQLLYEGLQRLAFDDFKGRFVPIPPAMLESVKDYKADLSVLKFTKLKQYFNSQGF